MFTWTIKPFHTNYTYEIKFEIVLVLVFKLLLNFAVYIHFGGPGNFVNVHACTCHHAIIYMHIFKHTTLSVYMSIYTSVCRPVVVYVSKVFEVANVLKYQQHLRRYYTLPSSQFTKRASGQYNNPIRWGSLTILLILQKAILFQNHPT